MTKSFAPSTHCFSAIKHNMFLKAALVTDHGGGSRDEDRVAIVFVMVTVMYVQMTPRASSVIVGVLALSSESSSSTTIGLWKEPSGALGREGPELFED